MATVTKRGPYQWRAQVRRQDFPAQSRTFEKKADAIAWAADVESRMARHVWVSSAEAEATTLAEALTRYEREVTPKKRSAADEVPKLRVISRAEIAKRMLASVRSTDIAALRDKWLADGSAPATVVRLMALLSHVFSIARREWGMESLANPVQLVSKPRVSNARTRRLIAEDPIPPRQSDASGPKDEDSGEQRMMDGEIDRLVAATQSQLLPALIRIAVETGMRRGELCKVRWQHLDLARRVAHLPAEICKNGEARDVPLSPLAIDTLNQVPRHASGRVFPLAPHSVTRAFDRAVQRARAQYEQECAEVDQKPDPKYLTDLHWHDLRHESTSRLAALFQMHELAKIIGHRTPQMLLRYYHPDAAELAKKLG